MLRELILNETTRFINRLLAWILAILVFLLFISGYALIKKIHFIPNHIAVKMHLQIMILTIVLFAVHVIVGSILLYYQRKTIKKSI